MIETPYVPEPLSRPHHGMRITGDPSRVLIVDDDESLRETIADLLELAGFHPIKASNAAEALVILQQDHSVDALITDLAMPGADGVDLIRQAHEIRPELPALLLTGYAELTSAAARVGSSSFHILRKPVESQRLIKKLEALVTGPANP